MRDALLEALAVPMADPTVTDVSICGARARCSAAVVISTSSARSRIPPNAHVVRLATSIGRAIDAVRDRVTAHMHGHCAGSGVELAAFAGTVVATPDTLCSLPEIGLGLIPGAGGTVSLTRRIGRQRVGAARVERRGHRCRRPRFCGAWSTRSLRRGLCAAVELVYGLRHVHVGGRSEPGSLPCYGD